MPETNRRGAAPWREAWALLSVQPGHRALVGSAVSLGALVSVAEATSIGLAVAFLFTVLGGGADGDPGGLPGRLQAVVAEVFGGSQAAVAAVLIGLTLLSAALVYANAFLTAVIYNRLAETVRDRIHERYLRAPFIDLQRVDQGQLIHTLSNESWTVAEAASALLRMAVSGCAVAVFGLGLLALSWQIALTVVAGGVLAVLALRLLSHPARRLGQRTLEANHLLADRMMIAISGMRTLRLFAQEEDLSARFAEASRRVRRRAVREEVIKSGSAPLVQVFALLVLVLIVAVTLSAGIESATAVAAVALIFRAQPYLSDLEANRVILAGFAPALREVRAVIEDAGAPPAKGTVPFGGLRSALRFEGVVFSHDPRRPGSLAGVDLAIRQGRTTALVGPSGSGKTTVLNLLLRLYEPQEGRITADGTDIRDFTRQSWLGRIAIAGQDVELLEGTLRQNLLIARPSASAAEVEAVCRDVELSEVIEALPDGLDTPVGAAARSFSGGQRQRIGLARALLRDPDILVLDEATSALEADRESRIRARIAERLAGRTIVVVSHRPGTAEDADDVIRLDRGRVASPPPSSLASLAPDQA